MELVKRVDLEITPLGDIAVTEHPKGEHRVFHTEVNKEMFISPEEFMQFLHEYVLPKEFSTYCANNVITITNHSKSYTFKFKVDIIPQGIVGFTFQDSFEKPSEQIFFYAWGSNMNTLSFFIKLHKLSEKAFKLDQVKKWLRKVLNNVLAVSYVDEKSGKEYYDVAVQCDPFDYRSYNINTYRVEVVNGSLRLLGRVWEDNEGLENIDTVGSLTAKIQKAEREIQRLKKMEVDLSKTEKDVMWDAQVNEQLMESQKEFYRNRPRNPALQRYATQELIDILHKGSREFPFSEADIRTELCHRPHIPNKAERKEIRRAKAHGGIRKSKNR